MPNCIHQSGGPSNVLFSKNVSTFTLSIALVRYYLKKKPQSLAKSNQKGFATTNRNDRSIINHSYSFFDKMWYNRLVNEASMQYRLLMSKCAVEPRPKHPDKGVTRSSMTPLFRLTLKMNQSTASSINACLR